MGYLVATSGRILLPETLERQALTVLEVRMASRQGWFSHDAHVDTLGDLAQFAGAKVRREGEWLLVSTDTEGDPKWSEQADEFYRSLGSFVREGEVHVRGEDGQVWSYLYTGDGVVQRGDNGWDGTPSDAAPAPGPPTEGMEGTAPPAGPSSAPGGPDAPAPSQFQYPGREDPAPPPAPPGAPYGEQPSAPSSPGPGDQGPAMPDPRAERAWAEPPPASTGRTMLMTALLVVGVILIIGLALLVSGL